MPLAGIEPALLAELDFESSASTSSATGASPGVSAGPLRRRGDSTIARVRGRSIATRAGSGAPGPVDGGSWSRLDRPRWVGRSKRPVNLPEPELGLPARLRVLLGRVAPIGDAGEPPRATRCGTSRCRRCAAPSWTAATPSIRFRPAAAAWSAGDGGAASAGAPRIVSGHHRLRGWRSAAERRVRSINIVVPSPACDDDLSPAERAEDLAVEQSVTQTRADGSMSSRSRSSEVTCPHDDAHENRRLSRRCEPRRAATAPDAR